MTTDFLKRATARFATDIRAITHRWSGIALIEWRNSQQTRLRFTDIDADDSLGAMAIPVLGPHAKGRRIGLSVLTSGIPQGQKSRKRYRGSAYSKIRPIKVDHHTMEISTSFPESEFEAELNLLALYITLSTAPYPKTGELVLDVNYDIATEDHDFQRKMFFEIIRLKQHRKSGTEIVKSLNSKYLRLLWKSKLGQYFTGAWVEPVFFSSEDSDGPFSDGDGFRLHLEFDFIRIRPTGPIGFQVN